MKKIFVGVYDFPLSCLFSHDSGAGFIVDKGNGFDFYGYEEAKLSTVKDDGYSRTPERSLFHGFKELGVSPSEVTRFSFIEPNLYIVPPTARLRILEEWFQKVLNLNVPAERFIQERCDFVPHHHAHAMFGVITSPMLEGYVLSMDGGGGGSDTRNTCLFKYRKSHDNRVREFDSIVECKGNNSIANLHGYLTEAVGFIEDGKFSGLSAYGTSDLVLLNQLRTLTKKSDGFYWTFKKERIRQDFFNRKFSSDSYERKKVIYPQPGRSAVTDVTHSFPAEVVCATGTELILELTLDTFNSLHAKHPGHYTFVGGLFNNVLVNTSLTRALNGKAFFTMAPGDCGLSLGAAAWGLYNDELSGSKNHSGVALRVPAVPKSPARTRIFSPYIGPSFSSEEVYSALINFPVVASTSKHGLKGSIRHIAKAVADGLVAGVFFGKAEFGPRSLGHRSILADPRSLRSKQRVNQILKRRDFFMPFAPAIISESLGDWLAASEIASPYMQLAPIINPDKAHLIPAAVHRDGSSRVQAVYRDLSPFFHELIRSFEEITGLPVILNTSFNRHGIATVSTPRQALEHLIAHSVDLLLIGGHDYCWIIERSTAVPCLINSSPHLSEEDLLLELNHKLTLKRECIS